MSIPRAATSVQTKNRSSPLRVAAITASRSFCDRSAFSQSAWYPCACKPAATRLVSSRVFEKMIALSGFSVSMIAMSSASLSVIVM